MMDYESASSPKSTTSRNSRNVLLSNSEYNKSWSSKLGPRLDTASVLLISLNAVLLIAEYQIEGEMIGVSLRKGEEPRVLARDVGNFFQFMDVVFDFVFLVEWIICLFWVRSQHRSCVTMEIVGNTLLVICGLMEAVLIIATAWGIETSVTTFHVLHAIACLRVVRCFRVLRLFQGPQLLLTACNTFLHSLLWAMVFLLVFMLTFSLVLGNLLLEFFVDPNASDRYWVWERYGTTLRAMYTLFEITFSGSWPNSTRPLIEKVNAGLVLFFVVYITVVAFGLIRVITAVFLKDTLDAAANDADHQVTLRLQKKADYAQKLEAIFGAIDREGNGLITEERLVEALDYPVVRAYFQTLDLDVYESKALFHLLDDGDGNVTLEEFIDGMLRCKGQARAIEQVAAHVELKQLGKKMNRVLKWIERHNSQTSTATTKSERAFVALGSLGITSTFNSEGDFRRGNTRLA